MHEQHSSIADLTLAGRTQQHTDVSAARCYQCGKCSAGCPLAIEMDYPPSQIMRLLQVRTPASDEKVLNSAAIWLCLTCETCIARCPQEVDIPKLMDYLRAESLRTKQVNPKAKDILSFHKAFLDSIQMTGRLYEVGLISDYKTRSWHFIQDVLIAPWMILRGKLHLIPEFVKEIKHIRRIFAKTKVKEAKP